MSPNQDDSKMTKRGHVILFPGQSPGLFGPFVQILYHLNSIRPGFIVTLVTPSSYFTDLTKLHRSGSLQGIELRLEEISGKILRDDKNPQFPMSTESLCKQAFLETEPLRKKLTSRKGTAGAPTVIICDMLLPWCKDFADELQIPCYLFYHCGLIYTLNLLEFPKILKAGLDPQIAIDDDDLSPGQVASSLADADVLSLLRSRDYSSAFLDCPEYKLSTARNTLKSAGILLNTAETLESSHGALSTVKELMGPSRVFCIGPSVQIPGYGLAYSPVSTGTGLPWLDSQQKKSVLYVAFGSLAVLSKESIAELAAALESSRVPFLFVVTAGPEKLSEILPPGFEQRTSGQGRIETSWVAQGKILQHPAIGGFLTHCGWNSILEGICSGVPFIAWPISADQPPNARYLHEIAKVGIAIAYLKPKDQRIFDGITRKEIETAVRKLMLEEEGRHLGSNVEKLQRSVASATAKGGSSYQDVRRFFDHISS